MLPAFAQQGYDIVSSQTSSIPISDMAEYSCIFQNQWSGVRHPNLYPADAHWSPPVLAAHNENYQKWAPGGTATSGVEIVAESGNRFTLEGELSAAIPDTGDVVNGFTTFNRQQQMQTLPTLSMDSNHLYMSSISMVAPSPDWFTGFYNFLVMDTGTNTWLSSFVLATYPFDAGTETGDRYQFSNPEESPQQVIEEFTVDNARSTGVFVSRDGSTVLPVALWECTLLNSSDNSPSEGEVANDNSFGTFIELLLEFFRSLFGF